MTNEKNLISMADRAPEEARAICARGGRASGEARRKRRTLEQAAKAALRCTPRGFDALKRQLEELGRDPEAEGQPDVMALMIGKAVFEALDGDWDAFKIVLDCAQVVGRREKIEKERIKAYGQSHAVSLTVESGRAAQIMAEVAERMAAEPVTSQPPAEGAP